MAEDEAIFDPTKKKKKKKKTTFDIDAALAEGNDALDESTNGPDESEAPPASEEAEDGADIDLDFTKQKKKKKKKPFSTDDLDTALNEVKEETMGESGNQEEEVIDDNFDLDFNN